MMGEDNEELAMDHLNGAIQFLDPNKGKDTEVDSDHTASVFDESMASSVEKEASHGRLLQQNGIDLMVPHTNRLMCNLSSASPSVPPGVTPVGGPVPTPPCNCAGIGAGCGGGERCCSGPNCMILPDGHWNCHSPTSAPPGARPV